jgi:hypothetical protein
MAFEQLTEFDKIVKSALEGVEEAVPSSVWDNIASKLDAIAGAAAAGTAITSVSSGSAASGTVASGTAAGSATTGSVATGATAGTTATGTAATGAAAGTTATTAASGAAVGTTATTAATGAAAGTTATSAAAGAAAGSAAAGAAAAGGAVAASSNVITIALASVAAAGVIGGGAALVLNNSNNQHIIEEPKPITEVVVDTTSETMPEDTTIDLVKYIRHQKPVIDEKEPVQETSQEASPEQKEEPEEIAMDRPAPQTEKSEVQWEIQPKKSSPRFAVSAGYLNSIDRTSVDVSLNGFYVGISYNIPINKSFGIAPGLYYSVVWSGPVNRWGGRIFFDDAKITEHYLDVPVYANYVHQFNDLYGLRVFAGPTFSTCLASKYEYNGLKCNSFDEMNYTRFDLMLGGGASFEFRQRYTVTAGFDIGLLRRNGEGGKDHMRSKLYFGIGYNF